MDFNNVNYWEVRKILSKTIFPRTQHLYSKQDFLETNSNFKTKGRKKDYGQFNLLSKQFESNSLLFKSEIEKTFIEISSYAAVCPLPLNIDLYDNMICPFNCIYCFANSFRTPLYSAFFDNYKEINLRTCRPEYFIPVLEKLFNKSNVAPQDSIVAKALQMKIPIKIGVRFENLLPIEKQNKITLTLMEFLAKNKYPFIINTKSPLIAHDEYIKALSLFPEGTGVQMTLLSANNELIKKLEPGAPLIKARLKACKLLTQSGIKVVARLKPLMIYINDEKALIDEYIGELKEAGIQDISTDLFASGVMSPKTRHDFYSLGFDFDRSITATTYSQTVATVLYSLLLRYFRQHNLRVSSFDFGQISENDHKYICCGFDHTIPWNNINFGNANTAIRFIQYAKKPVTWSDFENFVMSKGGFLSKKIYNSVYNMWNLGIFQKKNLGCTFDFAGHLSPIGQDENGLIWKYNKHIDFKTEAVSYLFNQL